MSSLKLFNDFVPQSVEEGSVRPMDDGRKIVFLNHGSDRTPIMLQTSVLRTIKGLEANDFNGVTKYTMELALTPDDVEYQKLKEFDERIIDLAANSKNKWITTKNGSVPTKEFLQEVYSPSLKIPRDKNTGEVSDRWPPTFKINLPQKYGTSEFDFELWDSNRQRMNIMDFISSGQSRNAQVTVILRCSGIYTSGKGFGTTWKAQQILVHSTGRANIGSFAFLNAERILDNSAYPPAAPTLGASSAGTSSYSAPAPVPVDEDEYIDDSD
ncbi:hypothetical protein TetV_214 [Tetraselmis virus 1]|uniref:Uncharacterized protein n=1 Tax=Tetraselmis virus 1 TaxID=2060617 RepID=A0A2P0VN27_9VIRU|nr:hypothetical protein QJ968_gp214 [Tetraselmis virus 1]AUF82306.1 hypothetical protein TetV_214 [Tetraselmis virus 1]